MNDDLLTIGEAAEILGVSEPALRTWTDEGQIKAFVTPGGHRRYLRSELKKFIGLNQKRLGIKSLTEKLEGTAAVHREIGAGPWRTHLDEADQHRFAALGRQLLALLTQCLTKPSKPEDTFSAAREIGRSYGELTGELNMPLVASVSAFIRHRQPMLTATFDMMKRGEITDRQMAEAMPLIDRAIDEALISLVQAREEQSANIDEETHN
ncbi:helix-turn-helix domain-containing protein [Dehalogenimonas etheniformans]|uniref:helix-turn-helix domain-containing protein n=1 Tax=Dehalogenimonas etheniformans TaxID=1536648 RepID=UPI000CC52F84|nr:helix-turn-helix domain-containing protein [Dehalogenimonas etheniformans]QNT76694.1 helix-turn-helix domain-containing protein [Dehalogenimonas etheniformans]